MADPEKIPTEEDIEEERKNLEGGSGGEPENPEPQPETDEPPVRKSAQEYIQERRGKREKKEEEQKFGDEDDDDYSEYKNNEFSPEGNDDIQTEVQRGMKPVLDKIRTQTDDQELNKVFSDYPGAKEMESTIRKYMEHPVYQAVSVEFIYLGLAAKKEELKEKKAQADEEAAGSSMGGHSRRPMESGDFPDVSKMSDKQIDELAFKAKTGQI